MVRRQTYVSPTPTPTCTTTTTPTPEVLVIIKESFNNAEMYNTSEEKTVKHTNSIKGTDHKESTVKEAVQKATEGRTAAATAEADWGKRAFGNLIRNLP